MSIRQRSISSRELLPHIEGLYALMYLPVLISGTAFMLWYELTRKAAANGHAAADSVYAIIIDVGYVAVGDAGVTFGVVEGGAAIMVLARRWLERQEQRGFEQGLGQGLEQGGARQQKKWEGWNGRRLQAQEEGRDFNEPPPSLDDDE